MISFPCGSCNKQLKVKDVLVGKKVKCPGCGQPVVVPALAAAVRQVGEERMPPSVSAGGEERILPPKNQSQVEKESLSGAEGQTALSVDGKGQETQSFQGPGPQSWDFLAPAEKPDEIGRLGPYRVLKVLGAGGMGVVFRAEDPHLERLVALKAMLPSMASSPSSKERFFREAKAAAALKHPHIVTIFQVGEDRGAPFLAMEFLEGESLDDRLKRETRLPVPDILRIGREIAEGLEAAHEKGLIHRDIKPANLWLEGKKGHVKILDFGLARAMGDTTHLTQSGAIIGTPAYMAPEQAEGEAVDHRCDLFSLGSVLYRMCTGEMPFKGSNTIAILRALALVAPIPPGELADDVPQPLSKLVMQLLAKKPEDRPKSAKVVAETLQEIEDQTAETTAAPARQIKTAEMTITPGRKTGKAKGDGGTKQMEVARTQAGKSGKRRFPLLWLLGGGVLGLVMTAAIVLFWPTPYGTVRIESDDPNVEIVFDKDGPTIKAADKEPISLRAGEHGLLIKRGDFSFEADKFMLKKDQTITLKLEWLPGKVQVVQDGKVIASHAVPPPATFTNSLGMKFVWIPPGDFMMGSPKEEIGRDAHETHHKVTLTKGFYMGVYTVTQEEWQAVKGNNPSHFKGEKNLPVEWVSWDDCQEFTKKLRDKDKKPYRLPTEAEWEYGCRAGTTTPFHFGETISTDQANYNGNFTYGNGKKGVIREKTTPVGSFPANAFGLHDMHGNVWQWCQDWYEGYLQKDVIDPQGPENGGGRVLRGGSWLYGPVRCRSASRGTSDPGGLYNDCGLRVCFSVEDDGAPTPKKDPPKKEEAALPPNPFTNSIGMKFVWIPPGSFEMGSPKEEIGRGVDGGNETQHKVTLTKGFYMGVYTVTQEEWQVVTGNNPSGFTGEKNLPVEQVSWDDCQEFIKKLRDKDKKLYRLPTEAEWEYACRAGTTTPFSFGETISTDQANYNGDFTYGTGKKGVFRQKTTPVGTFPANAFGLHEMHGNVWQWCQDWLGDYPQKDMVDPQGPEKGEMRVMRGGSWFLNPQYFRSAYHSGVEPGTRRNTFSLRVCFSVQEDGILAPKKDIPKKEEAAVPPNPFTNSIGIKFVWIPPGTFMMGSPKEEKDRQADAGADETQHKVTLTKGFYMGVYTVTQEQWKEVMGNNPSFFLSGKNLPVVGVTARSARIAG
jgi:formylglycine-generating enzyme required for sulfatase activity/serine/threonine protein kinase